MSSSAERDNAVGRRRVIHGGSNVGNLERNYTADARVTRSRTRHSGHCAAFESPATNLSYLEKYVLQPQLSKKYVLQPPFEHLFKSSTCRPS